MTQQQDTGLVKASKVAEFLDTTPGRLAKMRMDGDGPPFVKLGRSVRYRWSDVHRWVDANVTGGAT